jgi:hypothetical protein
MCGITLTLCQGQGAEVSMTNDGVYQIMVRHHGEIVDMAFPLIFKSLEGAQKAVERFTPERRKILGLTAVWIAYREVKP